MNSLYTEKIHYHHPYRDSRGGGVCIIIRNMLFISSHKVSVPSKFAFIEIVCADLFVNVTCGVRLIALYIPPHIIKDEAMCDLIIAALEHLSNTNLPVCIMDNLNLPVTTNGLDK